jgi:hypothetical protein
MMAKCEGCGCDETRCICDEPMTQPPLPIQPEELRSPRRIQRERDDGYPYVETVEPTKRELAAATAIATLQAELTRVTEAAKKLSLAAQTTGGTAGRDEGLCAAIDSLEEALAAPQGGETK